MNIFLLSRTDHLNIDLASALKKEIVERGGNVAYISSQSQSGEKVYYLSSIQDYKAIDDSITLDYFDLSENFSDEDLNRLSQYKTVYLSGGNTYTFLSDAKKRKLQPILEKVLHANGLLIGASAGSIMMTSTIDIASSCDENNVSLRDTSGFNFVPFEFHPHYTEADDVFLSQYVTKNTIYLCRDGDGIFISDTNLKEFGEIKKVKRGVRIE